MGPHKLDWVDRSLIAVMGILLSGVFGILLAVRQNDVAKIQWLIDQNVTQEARILTLEARQQGVLHELDRIRDEIRANRTESIEQHRR